MSKKVKQTLHIKSSLTSKNLTSFLVPQEELHLFHYMIDKIGDELMLLDADGGIVYLNDAAQKALGHSREKLSKKKIWQFFKEKIDLAGWKKKFYLPLKSGKGPIIFSMERVVPGKGTQTIETTAVFLHYGSKDYVLSITRDISLRILKDQKMRETDKMKALSLFVSGTAQEIKYPLQAVSTKIQQMLHQYKNRDFEYIGFKEFTDIMNTVQHINNQIRYCYDIANKLLLLNKRRAGLKESDSNINEVIKNSIYLMSQQLKQSKINVRFILSDQLPRGAISQSDLNEIVTNLSSNAIEAMPAGGNFTVKTYYANASGVIHVDFKDEGVGIPKEVLSRVFEPFFTTKQTGPGHNAGLGLSIVYSIVKECHGDVVIESSQRHGTIVKIILPVAKKQPKKR